ncbi:MAG: ATP-binding protein [Pseudomonadota bacterium]|nr:ATP-binding protein [Pseudomonadota bacterium]
MKEVDARLQELKLGYEARFKDPSRFEQDDPDLQAIQRTAALRGWFNPTALVDEVGGKVDSEQKSRWLHQLRAICIIDPASPDRWILLDRYRFASIRLMASEGTLHDAVHSASGDPHTRLAANMLSGNFDPAVAPAEALAAASDVDRWLSVVPGHEQQSGGFGPALELKLRNDEFDRLSRDIVGREVELHQLMSFVDGAWRQHGEQLPLFRLQGIGGVGKSTLLAEFVRRPMVARYHDAIVVWIDYDRLRIRAAELSSVLLETMRQLAWALPEASDDLKQAREELRAQADDPALAKRQGPALSALGLSESSDADSAIGSDDDVIMRAMTETIANALRRHAMALERRPVLIVLDTVEQLERAEAGRGDVLVALQILRQKPLPRLAVIASGRSVFSRDRLPWDVQDYKAEGLTGLSRAFSRELLVSRERLSPADADKLLKSFADLSDDEFRQRIGVPMLLTLLARLHREGRLDLSGDDLDHIRNAATAEMAAGYIYHRVLDHLPEDLRRVAHPGLVLRKVTEEILHEVILPVIVGPDEIEKWKGKRLFDRLINEGWLVDRTMTGDAPAVQHRPELRRAMLLLMYEDPDADVTRELVALNQRARDWYRARMKERPETADESLLEAVYHSVALAVLTGRVSGLRIREIRNVRSRLKDFVTDFPEEHRAAVSALVLGDSDPVSIARLPAKLRVPVLAEKLRTFVSRRQYREGLSFCAELSEEDRGRTPSLSWLAIRCFLQSGQWATHQATIAPLIAGPRAVAFQFGKGRPSVLPYMAAFASPDLGPGVANKLAHAANPPGITGWVSRRYDIISTLFAQVDRPSEDNLEELQDELLDLYTSLGRRYASGDRRQFSSILTNIQLRLDSRLAHSPPDRLAGLAQIGLAGIAALVSSSDSLSSARLVTICRSVDAEMARTGTTRQPIVPHWVAMFDDFHAPLGSALAVAVTSVSDAYSIADRLWPEWPIRPYDLRPANFAEACGKEVARPERFKTLVALADRAELTPLLYEAIEPFVTQSPDFAAVFTAAKRWRAALAPHSPIEARKGI